MAEILKCFCVGEPEPQPRPRGRLAGKGPKAFVQFYDAKEYPSDHPKRGQKLPWVIWREAVTRTVLSCHRGAEVTGPIRLTLEFYYPRPQYLLTAKAPAAMIWHTGKDDCDNLQKLVQDVLTECKVWGDDNQVCSWGGDKHWVARGGKCGCWIIVETLEETAHVLFAEAGVIPIQQPATDPPAIAQPAPEKPVRPIRPEGRPKPVDLTPQPLCCNCQHPKGSHDQYGQCEEVGVGGMTCDCTHFKDPNRLRTSHFAGVPIDPADTAPPARPKEMW